MSFRRLTILAGALAGAAASVSITLAGCGSSTSETGVTPDGATEDAAQDSTLNDVVTGDDGATGTDAQSGDGDAGAMTADGDATVMEGGEDAAQEGGDATPGVDGGGEVDGDAAGQADADAGAQPDGSAGFDASALVAYANNAATAWCQRIFDCCGTDSGVDYQGCTSTFRSGQGWEYSLPRDTEIASGHIQLNPDAGTGCINALRNFACPTSTAAQWATVSKACFAAVQGTVAIGGSCDSNFDCVPGSYCATVPDAGVEGGTGRQCAALLAPGQNCDLAGDPGCSYLGSSNTGYYCNLIDNPDGGATCQTLRDSGTPCTVDFNYYDDQACKALLCGDDYNCGSVSTYPYSYLCTQWIVDAGGGG
jgi:hypothetical protein